MKVSIITPCYNSAAYISRAIASVQAQSISDWEMIVVDDGSDDDSAVIVNQVNKVDPRVKILQKENGGSESATKKQLNSQLYLCEKYNISKRFFCRHEIILIIIQQLICFLRTGNCSLSLYQSKRLQMLMEV